MTRLFRIRMMTAAAATLLIGGCDWATGSSADTQMRNVEILPGTASDEMITLDQASGEGTSIDTSVAAGPAVPGAPSVADDAAEPAETAATDGGDGETSNNGDVIIRPPAGGAEPTAPRNRPADPAK
jgi:hypothetical protein